MACGEDQVSDGLVYGTQSGIGADRMKQIVETERLRIRHFEAGDWQDVFAHLSDPEVVRYLPEEPYTPEQTKEFIKELEEQSREGGLPEKQAVILKSNGALIGHTVFHSWYGVHRTFEIGWVFDRRYHGRGYATEAARSLLHCGFEKLALHRIIATCNPENVASYRVMEKLGMRREAHFRQCIYHDGEWEDEFFYAILKVEWEESREK
jgi:ribosomal-protein-alanine N-acetyltransferase